MFKKFDIDDKNIFKVCVVATMSSGKSTFINSIIGEEIMPEKNEACTARTMAVLDNDNVIVKKAHIIRRNGAKELVKIDSSDVLERVNNDEDVVDFLVETNIPSIKNTSRALMLVDTPGVNNSGDERHGERTEEFLKQMDMGVIVYLLNATQLATNDDSILLQLVSEHIKKKKSQVKIIFVINKIDALDEETESISETVKIAKEYIENYGISSPIIYPLSALSAKALRMVLYRKKMTKRELRKLEDIYEHYQSKDNNMLDYALLDDLSEEVYEIGDLHVSAQQLRRAIDNTGITAIERRLENFMSDIEKHYSPEVVIKCRMSESIAQEFQNRIEKIASFPSQCEWKSFKEVNTKIYSMDVIQKANRELPELGTVSVDLEMANNVVTAVSDIGELMSDIEIIKKNIFDIFKQGKYIAVKRMPGLYFSPEKDESNRLSGRNFYLMSEYGTQWESMKFSKVMALIDDGKVFYLYNEYSSFIFKVNQENAADIVALLDTRIPINVIRIAGLRGDYPSFDDVNKFIGQCIAKEREKQAEIEKAQELLKRTYKGIVFDTEKEKNNAIDKEKELQEYCINLVDVSHEELWHKKEEVSQLPNSIFADYLSRIVSALEISENNERYEFIVRIESAYLDELEEIEDDLLKHHYSSATNNQVKSVLNQRRLQCQRYNLEAEIKDFHNMSRIELKDLIGKIFNLAYDEALCKEYISKINIQYDILEEKELRKMCADIEQRDIESLESLKNLIRDEKYQDKFASKYFDMIASRIDFLHVKNLEEYCSSINIADRNTLSKIKNRIDEENCRPELKNRFYEAIEEREERLDYEDLCNLTVGLERKSLHELTDLYRDLSTGNYNQKFVKTFIVKVRVDMELTQHRQVEELIKNLQVMSKEQVLDAEREINSFGYSDYVVSLAKEKIIERLYELDLYELMTIENDFDRLNLSSVENLRAYIRQKDICERSFLTYSKKLHERECVIAYEKVSQRAGFARQLMEQYGLNDAGIKLAIFATDYMQLLENYFAMGGEKKYDNVPVLFFSACSSLAITKTDLYYKTASGFCRTKISEIRTFSIEKKLFSEVLAITFINGTVLNLVGGINKKNSIAVANFLTVLIQNINNDAILGQYQVYNYSVPCLRVEDFEFRSVPLTVTNEYISKLTLNKVAKLNGKIKLTSIKTALQDNWLVSETKVRDRFGINNDRNILLYYDNTILGSVKEGVAFGFECIYIKKSNQSLISIPYTEVYRIEQQSGKGIIETITNNIYIMDLGNGNASEFLSILDEYVRGIQFMNSNSIGMKTEEQRCSVNEKALMSDACPKCGYTVPVGARFCSHCGTKV